MRTKCIFCSADILSESKKEHIVNASIGGTLAASGLVCNVCNEGFSFKIDPAISDKYSLSLNVLSPVLKRVSHTWSATLKDTGKVTRFAPGMTVIPKEKPIYDEATREIKGFFARPENVDRMTDFIKKLRPNKQVVKQYAVCKEDDMPIRQSVLLDENELRVVAKMAYEYLRYKSADSLPDDLFVQTKNYIMGAELKKRIAFLNADTYDVRNRFDSINKKTDFCHRIAVSGGGGIIEAAVILFDRIGYRVLLSDGYAGSAFSYFYQKNILKNSSQDFMSETNERFPCGSFQGGDVEYVMGIALDQVFGLVRDGYWYVDMNHVDAALKRYLGPVISGRSDGDVVVVSSADVLNCIFQYADQIHATAKEDKCKTLEMNRLKATIVRTHGLQIFNERIPDFSKEFAGAIWKMHLEVMNAYKNNIGKPLYGLKHFSSTSK